MALAKLKKRLEIETSLTERTGRAGPCDVTSKKDLERLVTEISKKEDYINLLSMALLA